MINLRWVLLFLLLLAPAKAQDAEALGRQIAAGFGFSLEGLMVADKSAEYAQKTKGQIVFVLSLNSNNGSFPSTWIVIGKKGSILSSELEADCEKAISTGSTVFKKFDLQKGAYTYTGLGIAGPGGSEEAIVATWPERGIDLQIKMVFPGGVPANSQPEAYNKLIEEGPEALQAKLVKEMGELVGYAEKQFPRVLNDSRKFDSPDKASESGMALPTGREVDTPSRPNGKAWPVMVALAVALCSVAGWRLSKRRR